MGKQKDDYFRFEPKDEQPGFTPLLGDIEPGGVYLVRPEHAERFDAHPEWERATKTEFNDYQEKTRA